MLVLSSIEDPLHFPCALFLVRGSSCSVVDIAKEERKETSPEPVVDKAAKETPKEPASKDIPLPFTVEHVSQPATPSEEKPEQPKAEEAKPVPQEPEPSTSTEVKAFEIAVPAVLAAAVATASVAKVISSAPEPTTAPLSPTIASRESVDYLHKSMLPLPRSSNPTVNTASYIDAELDSINETLQQLTKTISQTSATQPAVESCR
ncbi:uncharacterized protein PAC_12518 [Phialocephala subalpina]|uniref:Uncharacterized protein n=1 Tax=Phialocephala subalpina TaxID=576137 RepID=A0A1L7XC65_9HELO|nr:uncharacterized protein PAC_12518 [Phialocephala subalpina]